MASRPSRPGRALLGFALVLAAMFAGVAAIGTWAPTLGLDLQGGTRITLSASAEGGGEVTTTKMAEAVDIIRNRVNGTGVAEAEVTTQGGNNIIVEIPGEQRGDLVDVVGETAQLRFRIVAAGPAPGQPLPTAPPTSPPGATPTPGATGQSPSPTATAGPGGQSTKGSGDGDGNNAPSRSQARPAAPTTTAAGGDGTPAGTATPEPTTGGGPTTPQPTAQPTLPADTDPLTWQPNAEWERQFAGFSCPADGADPQIRDIANQPLITCDEIGVKYLLGPAVIEGTQLDDASAGIPQGTAQWVVNLDFDGTASETFATVTQQLFNNGGQFAIVLDGVVLSAPGVNEPILNGQAQISGNFNQQSAQSLANSLRYGALPLSFRVESVSEEGPQLAADQLRAGLLAGAVGLLLVVVYCVLYYRGLALVVIASLVAAGAMTYAAALLLSKWIGFTLTLPGIAGLIVAVGITADSFIVYFERLRDEVRDGKTLRSAVEAGWLRARQTILAADAVSFLAAMVLFIVAVGVVKGFAFALGLVTLIDALVVFFFTKPLVTFLSRTRFFGQGHPLSGLDPKHLGVSRLPMVRGRRRPAAEEA